MFCMLLYSPGRGFMENKLIDLFINEQLIEKDIVDQLLTYLKDNNYDIERINNILKAICNYNIRICSKLKIENKEFQSIIDKRNSTLNSNNNVIVEKNNDASCDKSVVDNSLKLDISFYLESLKGVNDYDDIKLILPNKHTDNYQDIINLILLKYYEEYIFIKSVLKDIINSDEEYDYYTSEKNNCLNMIYNIKKYNREINSSEKDIYENRDNKIVFLTTGIDNVCVKNDIEKSIPYEFYPDLMELINSIKNGTFKNVKVFNNNKALYGLCQVKYHDVRLTFKRISKNVYVLIQAFVKKCYTSSQYHNMLEKRYSLYKTYHEQLLEKANDVNFLYDNSQILLEIEDMLLNKKVGDFSEKVNRNDRK